MSTFRRCRFQARDAVALAAFLDDIHQNHWSLSSLGFRRRPPVVPATDPTALVLQDRGPRRLGTFLLKQEARIIAMLQVDDKDGDGKVALVSGVETHPEFQRRGTFWRHLGEPCLRVFCRSGFDRLEALTWTFNRKGIPLYKRSGFRAVPGTSLLMRNYLPLILKHPATRPFFMRHDFIRSLQGRRSYGYDRLVCRGLNLFEYAWKSGEEELRVLVDWERHDLVCIQRHDWSAWCSVVPRQPVTVLCELVNRGGLSLAFCVRVPGVGKGRLRILEPGMNWEEEVRMPTDIPMDPILVELEVAGERVPFALHHHGSGP